MPTETNKGNISKAVVLELLPDVTNEQLETIYRTKDNKRCSLVSRKRIVDSFNLTGAKKKAIEDYVYPAKPKRKPKAKKGTKTSTAITKETYKDMSNDKLISSIKELTTQLQAMKEQLADRLK